jgi:hypothetical protein
MNISVSGEQIRFYRFNGGKATGLRGLMGFYANKIIGFMGYMGFIIYQLFLWKTKNHPRQNKNWGA